MIFQRLCLSSGLAVLIFASPGLSAESGSRRYEGCLSLANLNPVEGLRAANQWIKEKGGAPAEHCAAMALVELKRYPEAAARLDALGRAPDMGKLRPEIFDQAGNAWMMAGEADKAVASFSGALALSANDADLYADLARAQAMKKSWREAEADLNEALRLSPRRADLLVLRASARDAQGKWKDARQDVDAALALKPLAPEALAERGEIAKHAGDIAAARRDFESVLKVQKSGESAETARLELQDLGAKPNASP
jgi:tetratricopeptide (TPR) repeat protein